MNLMRIPIRWSSLKISQRIQGGLIIAIISVLLLFAVFTISISRITEIDRQAIAYNEDRLTVAEFRQAVKAANLDAEALKRLTEIGAQTIKDDTALELAIYNFVEAARRIDPIIKREAPEELAGFRRTVQEVSTAARQWGKTHGKGPLLILTSSFFLSVEISDQLAKKLNDQIVTRIKRGQTQLRAIRILSASLAGAIIVFLFALLFPLLRRLGSIFGPLRQASIQSLAGTQGVFANAASIDESIAQLLEVMENIGKGIEEVAISAQKTSSQAAKINGEAAGAVNAAMDLADEAAGICKSIDENQELLRRQTEEIQALSANVVQALGRIDRNANVAERLAAQVSSLEAILADVGQFLMMVDEINDQIELLALNAGIEAARAGEHGRGFGIVAERLGGLSDQTKQFTGRIMASIGTIQEASRESAAALREVIQGVRGSVAEVANVNQEFTELRQVLASLYLANENLHRAAGLQLEKVTLIRRNAEEISQSVADISAQAIQVSASMQELSAGAQEVIGQVQTIGQNVSETKTAIEQQVELASLARANADQF